MKLSTPLVGYRLQDGRYQPIVADAAGARRSDVLGMDLHVLNRQLRFRDLATGENLRTYSEAVEAETRRAEAAEREWPALKARADAADREIVRLWLRR